MVTFTNNPIFVFLKARKFSVFKCCSHFLGKVSLFFVCVSNVSILFSVSKMQKASADWHLPLGIQDKCVNVRSKTNR